MWSSNYTLGHLSQRNGNLCSDKTCAWMFIAALFVIAKEWKGTYNSFNGWIELGSSNWRNLQFLLIHTITWVNLQGILLSENSPSQRDIVWVHLWSILEMTKIIEMGNRWVVVRGWRPGEETAGRWSQKMLVLMRLVCWPRRWVCETAYVMKLHRTKYTHKHTHTKEYKWNGGNLNKMHRWSMSISLYCMIVLHMGKGHAGSVYYFLQLRMNLQWSQTEKFN